MAVEDGRWRPTNPISRTIELRNRGLLNIIEADLGLLLQGAIVGRGARLG